MCLIVVGWRVHPRYPLIVAANRDEFHARPSAPIGRWPAAPHVIGGRDLEAGGTWLGVTEQGRFAAITNVREPGMTKGAQSRGALPYDFLTGDKSAAEYASQIDGAAFSGFNLLLSDGENLVYCSNRSGPAQLLTPGIYGVSNHLLDSPWPKLMTAKTRFSHAICGEPEKSAIFEMLADREIVPDHNLPATGVPLHGERRLSAILVQSADYGTRASTLLTINSSGNIYLEERCFGPG